MIRAVTVLALVGGVAGVAAQTPSQPPTPAFDAVSIKVNRDRPVPFVIRQLPGGGFRMTNASLSILMGQAFPVFTWEIIGMPGWANDRNLDVWATGDPSLLQTATTQAQRRAMLRHMLADRFKLVTHFETREQPLYRLVVARGDRRLGPKLQQIDKDCAAIRAALETADTVRAGQRSAAPATTHTPAPCGVALTPGRIDGELSIGDLVVHLRSLLRRAVIDQTGLTGYYRIAFELGNTAGVEAAVDASVDGAPSVFTAPQEQLGLKVEPARGPVEVLVIDSMERPTPD